MRLRTCLAQRGIAALLLIVVPVGGPAAYAGSPADPASADLAVRVSGAPSAGASDEQVITATVTNRGPGAANGVTLRYAGQVDTEAVDPAAVRLCAVREPSAPPLTDPAVAPSLTVAVAGSCALPDLAPGRSYGLRSRTLGAGRTLGPVGELTVVVGHAGADPAPADNSATTRLGLPDRTGYRLYARSWDGPADRGGTVGVVPPGGVGDLRFEIGNSGRVPVNGFTITIQLPHRVAFRESRPGCAYARDRRSATCTYGDLPIVPAEYDADPDDRSYSALRFRHGFAVDPAAPQRTRLDDGQLRVEPVVTGYLPGPVTRLPVDVTGLRARDYRSERDRDGFTVFTGASTDFADADADGDADGDGLPVTGGRIGMLGVAGLGLAVAGAVLLLLARVRAGRSSR